MVMTQFEIRVESDAEMTFCIHCTNSCFDALAIFQKPQEFFDQENNYLSLSLWSGGEEEVLFSI